MPTARRSRIITAPPGELWELIDDPHHLPRWWPRVTRVEGVEDDAFTEVLMSPRGRLVRADFQIAHRDAQGLVLRWAQLIDGTPFARVLAASETELRLQTPSGAAVAALTRTSTAAAVPAPDAVPVPDAVPAPDAMPDPDAALAVATVVTLELRQSLRGFLAHLGMGRVRKAAQRTLDEALDGLERIVG